MHLDVQGQWWSIYLIQTSHLLQCLTFFIILILHFRQYLHTIFFTLWLFSCRCIGFIHSEDSTAVQYLGLILQQKDRIEDESGRRLNWILLSRIYRRLHWRNWSGRSQQCRSRQKLWESRYLSKGTLTVGAQSYQDSLAFVHNFHFPVFLVVRVGWPHRQFLHEIPSMRHVQFGVLLFDRVDAITNFHCYDIIIQAD